MPKHHLNDPVYNALVAAHDYNVNYTTNEIFLFAEEFDFPLSSGLYNSLDEVAEPGVEYTMANRLVRNLTMLSAKGHDHPILIHLKTCGGSWEEGMAIYDAIKSCPNPVTILNYTHARSMSSLIFLAGDKRVMMPHSSFMFHEGTFAFSGTIRQLDSEKVEVDKARQVMLSIYVDAMKQQGIFRRKSRIFIAKWLQEQMLKKEEVYLDARQAVEYGFADEIYDGNPDNLRVYTKAQLSRHV